MLLLISVDIVLGRTTETVANAYCQTINLVQVHRTLDRLHEVSGIRTIVLSRLLLLSRG